MEKHTTWFKAKLLYLNKYIHDADTWFSNFDRKRNSDNNVQTTGLVVDDGIVPDDSMSDVGGKRSSKGSSNGGRSGTATALTEEQEQQLKKERRTARPGSRYSCNQCQV